VRPSHEREKSYLFPAAHAVQFRYILRQLHVEMDQAVAAAYGWTDLDLGHGFHQTKQGLRYTISEPTRREILARLLKLNHECYAEEVAKGLHEKKGRGKANRAASASVSSEEGLFQ
jgi:hypothetical protein